MCDRRLPCLDNYFDKVRKEPQFCMSDKSLSYQLPFVLFFLVSYLDHDPLVSALGSDVSLATFQGSV